MKTRFTSIALTVAGVAVLGLGFANSDSGNAYAANSDDKLSIERVRISEQNLSNAQGSNRKCCDLNPLGATIDGESNLNNEEAPSNDHNGVQSDGNDVRSHGNGRVRSADENILIENSVGDDYPQGQNPDNDQSNDGHNNLQD